MYDTLPSAATTAPLASAGANARWRAVARNAFPFVVVGGAWEIVAHLGIFPPRLFPSLETVAAPVSEVRATSRVGFLSVPVK